MCKTIKQTVKFKASPHTIYSLLVDSKKHSAFTKHKAKIGKKVGAPFTAYSGHINGINVELAPGQRIVQAWRTKRFPVGIYSLATFNLKAKGKGVTEVTLIHRGVPKELIPGIENGWREHYWMKIKAYLSEG
jgi:activator of HSP90 ATPase